MSPLSGYVDAAIAHAKVVLSAGHFHNLAKLTHARSLVARLLADAEDYKPVLAQQGTAFEVKLPPAPPATDAGKNQQ